MTPVEPSPRREASVEPSILTVSGFLLTAVAGLLIWVLYREVGVIIPLVGITILLWPSRGLRWRTRLIRLLVALGSIWILYKARTVVYPLLFAVLVAYWLDPVVARLERRRIPRAAGALIAIVPVLALATLFAIFVLPLLIDQAVQLARAIPGIWEVVSTRVQSWIAFVMPSGRVPNLNELLKPFTSHIADVFKGIVTSFGAIAKGIGTVLGFIGMLVLAPVLAYYILSDFDRFREWVGRQIPERRKAGFAAYGGVAENIFRRYFRGQVLVALCVGVIFGIGLTIAGFPYSLLLGFVAGILNLVPILGFWIAIIIFSIAALISGHPGPLFLRLGILIVVEQVLESQILTPRIVGKAVGLNPVFTLLSVLVSGAILGPIGILVAVPAAAMLRSFLQMRADGRRAAGTINDGGGFPG